MIQARSQKGWRDSKSGSTKPEGLEEPVSLRNQIDLGYAVLKRLRGWPQLSERNMQ
jgi:hypothetical protein